MNITCTTAVVFIAMSLAVSAGTIVSLNGEIPEGKGWSNEGNIPGQVIESGGKKVLDLKDDTESGAHLYTYLIGKNDEQQMRKKGYEFNMRVNPLEPGAHVVTVRLKDVGSATLGFWIDEKADELLVSTYDYDQAKQVTGRVSGTKRFVDVKAVWDPRTGLEVFLNGIPAYKLLLSSSERTPRSSVEIGVPDLRRKGHILIESLSLGTR